MSDPGELGPSTSTTAPAAPSAPAPAATPSAPAAKAAQVSQYEKDISGQHPRWNAPKDADGSIARWNARQAARIGGHTAANPAAPAQADPAAAATKPADGAADTSVKVGNTTLTESEVQEFLARKAERESGRLQAFDSPEKYKVETSKEFKAPQGIEFAIDQRDPSLPLLKNWAVKNQIPQSALSEVVDVYAGSIVRQQAIGKAAYEAEVAKMGAAGPARIDAISLWLKGQLGDEGKVLSGVRDKDGICRGGILWTAAICNAVERLMNKNISGGGGGYRANGGDNGPSNPGKIPNYAGMSFEQRRQAQDQRRGR